MTRTIRPRYGDLEAATRPHTFQPSGEHHRTGIEICDLCGLAATNHHIHPENP